MKIIFFGTPDFALTILERLNEEFCILAAVTQPDRPKGRGNELTESPVKVYANENRIPVLQPETLKDKNIRETLCAYGADIFFVAAYGMILNKKILNLPHLGCLNAHASALPKYRGASPVQQALLNGDKTTGVTIIKMDAGIDTGDIILSRETEIGRDERLPSLQGRLASLGAGCAVDAIRMIENGNASYKRQDRDIISYAPIIKKEDGRIRWINASARILGAIRAYDPWPGTHTFAGDRKLTVYDAVVSNVNSPDAKPGTVLRADPLGGLHVKTGDGSVEITSVRAQSGKTLRSSDYLRGNHIPVGTVLD